jgi:hypothetical protein
MIMAVFGQKLIAFILMIHYYMKVGAETHLK